MSAILVEKNRINLSFETQISKKGRPFRLSGISLVTTKPAIYIKGIKAFRHGTIYSFRYLDVDNEFFEFEFDAFDNFVCKV
jgi:hypothetical protein